MQDSRYFLGRWHGPEQAQAEPVQYEPADLTTHAVLVGMTGSGKTGLLIALLEEAARQGTPAIIIDPKGDLTNLLLHFPELRPSDFETWIDPEAARRRGLSAAEMAAHTAERWRAGLADWGLGEEDIRALAEGVDYRIFTPGSTAGTPVNLLSSFAAPRLDWEAHREALRERIAATVTALLGLVGVEDIDPLRSREHILLANLLENAWSQGQSLDLTELILQVQNPPIERLGAFALDRFFPEKERFGLALLLNNFLAAPSFQTWLEGQPLDAPELLRSPEGKPRFSIFYLAHLSETERMFFVTLLLAAVETWMRTQRGTSGLRALLAFDEIVGYLPPVANPPSRPVLLRLLKQARAYGLGLVLATQNPADLNYKALSNAGTWFIGRLQAERDKERLLDGLQNLETGVNRAAFDQLIAALRPRLFLLHNVHQPDGNGPGLFTTRWTMNYLAGPLTRAQLPALGAAEAGQAEGAPESGGARRYASETPTGPLTRPANREPETQPLSEARPTGTAANPLAADPVQAMQPRGVGVTPARGGAEPFLSSSAPPQYSASRPSLPNGVDEYVHPQTLSLNRALGAQGSAFVGPLEPLGLIYRPGLLVQAEARYVMRRYNLTHQRRAASLLTRPDGSHPDWEVFSHAPFEAAMLTVTPLPEARFAPLPEEWNSARGLAALQKDFLDWVYRSGVIHVRINETFKMYAAPDVPEAEFQRRVDSAAREGMQAELDKLAASYDTKLETLKRRVERQEITVERREDEVDQRRAEQTGADVDFLTSIFTRRKRALTTPLSKRRMTSQARSNLKQAQKTLEALQAEWKDLQAQRQAAIQKLSMEWQQRAAQVTEVPVTPYRKDIFPELFGVVWLPYYLVQGREGVIEAAAFTV